MQPHSPLLVSFLNASLSRAMPPPPRGKEHVPSNNLMHSPIGYYHRLLMTRLRINEFAFQ